MPLEQNKKISLTKKDKYIQKKRLGILREAPQSSFLSGSLTVEAAIALPMFLFGVISILFFFQVLQVSQVTRGVLALVGSNQSLKMEEQKDGYLQFQKELLKIEYPQNIILGGPKGITWKEEKNEDYVNIEITYHCKFPISIFGIKSIPIYQQLCVKRWNGYQEDMDMTESNTQWVYITPNGESYHLNKDCRYLKLDISTLPKNQVKETSYTPCKVCGQETSLYSYYYVTSGGERYHTRLTCTGLKRSIYIVPIKECENRSPCSLCGGKEQ